MAFVEFTPETTPANGTKSTPLINLNQKSGTITLNQLAANTLGVKDGDKVKLLFEEDSVEDWYIVKDPKGFPLRAKSSGKLENYITNSTYTVRKFMAAIGVDSNSISCTLAKEPIKINKQTCFLLLAKK